MYRQKTRTSRFVTCAAFGASLLYVACGDQGARGTPEGETAAPPTPREAAAPAPPPTAPVDSGAPDGSTDTILQATIGCGPLANACAAPAAAGLSLTATYRKDAYLAQAEYTEGGPLPTTGGRVHLAGIARATGEVTRVRIDGKTVDELLTARALDWYHVWPASAVAGEPIWVAFHSRDASWDSRTSATISVDSGATTLLSGTFPVATAVVPLTSVTTASGGKTLLVHVKNVDSKAHTIARLVVDGKDVTASSCIPKRTLGAGETALVRVPRCAPAKVGAAWTVVLELSDGPASTGVGRVLPEQFPIEAWPKSADCPLPGGDPAAMAKHMAAGIDTLYMYFGNGGCGTPGATLVNSVLPSSPTKLKVLVGDDFLGRPTPESAITDTRAVAGFLTGDESDGEYEKDGYPAAELKARDSRRLWKMYPTLPTYNGGKTNRKVGAFAGMADIQGMDFYVAACAPHITPVGSRMPLRGAYDYLRNARDNHAPLPTWLYAQGLHSGWNKKVLGVTLRAQPSPAEILVQALSVAAAGGKGLMWFQTEMSEATAVPDSWAAIAKSSLMMRAVRPWLRESDPTALATATGPVLVEALRAPDAIVVPVIDLDVSSEPNDVECAKIFTGAPVPHHELVPRTTEVRVRVPEDLAIGDVFEVSGPTVKDAPAYTVVGREVRMTVTVGPSDPARLFVLASSKTARAEATANAR